MSLAAEARMAVRKDPFLFDALRAGVVNYAALARDLDIDGEQDAISAALRRFAEELESPASVERSVRVRIEAGLERVESDPLISVDDIGYASGNGELTGVIVIGDVDVGILERAIGLCRTHGLDVESAAVASDTLILVLDRRDGPQALRVLEDGLSDQS